MVNGALRVVRLKPNRPSLAAPRLHSLSTIHPSLTDAVGAPADDDDDLAAYLLGDAPYHGDVRDERAEGIAAAAHTRRGHGRLVVDVKPHRAFAPEAVAGRRARLADAPYLVVFNLLLGACVRTGAARGGRVCSPVLAFRLLGLRRGRPGVPAVDVGSVVVGRALLVARSAVGHLH